MFARRSDHDYNSFSDDEDRAAFGNFDIGAETYNEVLHDIKKDSKLTCVDLRSNYLYGTCLDILKDALKDNTTLKHLDLSYNEDIEDWVGEWITELKERNSPLQVKYDM